MNLGEMQIDLEYTPEHARRVQTHYMRQTRGLDLGLDTSVQQFVERLCFNDLKHYLLYFPIEKHKQLDQDEIIEILIKLRLWILSGMKQWLMPTLTFLNCLMKNLFLTLSVWEPWRRSGTQTFRFHLSYQWMVRKQFLLPVV
jgi:hypothetical protein